MVVGVRKARQAQRAELGVGVLGTHFSYLCQRNENKGNTVVPVTGVGRGDEQKKEETRGSDHTEVVGANVSGGGGGGGGHRQHKPTRVQRGRKLTKVEAREAKRSVAAKMV